MIKTYIISTNKLNMYINSYKKVCSIKEKNYQNFNFFVKKATLTRLALSKHLNFKLKSSSSIQVSYLKAIGNRHKYKKQSVLYEYIYLCTTK